MPVSWSTPFEMIWSGLRFSAHNADVLGKKLALPMLLGTITLFLFFSVYCEEILQVLSDPSGGAGSRLLGVAAAGTLLILFFHSVCVAAICEVILRRPDDGPSFMGIRPWSWRLYVANLRLVLLIAVGALIYWLAVTASAWMNLPPAMQSAAKVILLLAMFWFFLRVWFFLLPVCLTQGEDSLLTQAWRSSARHFWFMTAILLPLLLLIGIFQLMAQRLLLISGLISPLPVGASFAGYLGFYRDNLLPIVLLMALSYLVGVVIITAARHFTYHWISGKALPSA